MLLCTQGIGMPPAARQFNGTSAAFAATTAQTAGGGGSSSQGQRMEDLVGDAMDELENGVWSVAADGEACGGAQLAAAVGQRGPRLHGSMCGFSYGLASGASQPLR